jgi:hypothetical protein
MIKRNNLLHRQSVWKEIVDHLKQFLDTDTNPAKMGVKSEVGGALVVPQPIIESVVGEIEAGPNNQILEALREIDNSEVAEHVRKEDQAGKEAKRKGGKAKRKPYPS